MKKILLFTLLINILSSQIKSQCTFGSFPPSFTINPGFTSGLWFAKKYTLASTATLTGLGLNTSTNPGINPYRMAIYTDASSQPANLISSTAQSTLLTGINILSLPVATVIPAGIYWIVAIYGNPSTPTSASLSATPFLYQSGSLTTLPPNVSAWTTGSNYDIDYWAIINSPVITIGGPANTCLGSAVTLTASGANTYTWSTNVNTNTVSLSPTINTTYTVFGTSPVGCSGLSSITITVNALPTLSVTGNSTICSGTSLNQTVTGATSYTWSNGATTSTVLLSPLTNTVYSVSGMAANGCIKTTTVPIAVISLPLISVSGNSAVCIGSSLNQTVSGAASYSWSTGATTNTISVSPQTNTVYTATGTNTNGCSNTLTVPITVLSLPVVSISGNSFVCQGSSLSQTLSGAATYSWSMGITTNTILLSPTSNTVYSVIAIDLNGCVGTASESITVYTPPTLSVSLTNSIICAGESTTVNVNGAATYVWNTGETTLLISITPTITTSYTVTGKDVNGCAGSATVSQVVSQCTDLGVQRENKLVASVFPNPGKGIFEIKSNGLNKISTLEIFSYTGVLVKSEPVNSEDITLDLSSYSNGLYYVILHSKKDQFVIKLIKE